jgi:hypothetical protein
MIVDYFGGYMDDSLKKFLGDRDALLLEWMQSNEVVTRLKKKYPKEVKETIIDVAEKDPRFADTEMTKKATGK